MPKDAPCHVKNIRQGYIVIFINCIRDSPGRGLRRGLGLFSRVKSETLCTGFRGTGSFQKVVPGKPNMSQIPLNFPGTRHGDLALRACQNNTHSGPHSSFSEKLCAWLEGGQMLLEWGNIEKPVGPGACAAYIYGLN